VLVIDGLDDAGLAAAPTTAADAIAIDLASPTVHADRARARTQAQRRLRAIAEAGRPVFVRVADQRSGETEADLDAVIGEHLTAIVLSGAAIPQDVRDADVAIRKREMRLSLTPGRVRLIPEIDSAEGLSHLRRMLDTPRSR
jgi:citrate lyase beta subunit